MVIRLDKYLADMGLGTRSQVKQLLKKGAVSVNDCVEKDAARKIDSQKDRILYQGRLLTYVDLVYYMLYKPSGVVSAVTDPEDTTVVDLIKDSPRKDLFPVGRLDKDTTGLLLITNDGELAHRLLSPAHHVDKVYEVQLDLPADGSDAEAFSTGLDIGDDKPTLAARLELLGQTENTHVLVTLQEGRYHQVKRMFQARGKQVVSLKRLSMGSLTLDPALKEGEYRQLTPEEISALK